MSQETIEITRYPNRRLYDRSTGQYVTLQELEEKIRGGLNIAVTDSKTGEDLTRSVLTQMILERHPERMELLPVSFLHVMLRANGWALDWMRSYLQKSFAMMEQLTPGAMPSFPTPWSTPGEPSAQAAAPLPHALWEAFGKAWSQPWSSGAGATNAAAAEGAGEASETMRAAPAADREAATVDVTPASAERLQPASPPLSSPPVPSAPMSPLRGELAAAERDLLLARLEQLEQRLKQLEQGDKKGAKRRRAKK